MKTWVKVLCAACVLMLLLAVPVRAQTTQEIYDEQLKASGAEELYDGLSEETADLLSKLGVDELSFEALTAMQPQTVLSVIGDLVSNKAHAPFSAAVLMLGTMLILGFFSAFQAPLDSLSPLLRVIGALAVAAPLLLPLWQTMERVQAAAQSASVFSLGFAPVYAGILAAGGNAATAASYQTVMLAAAQGISVLISSVILPLLSVSLALGISGSMNIQWRLSNLSTLITRVAVWLIGISLTVFVGMLSLQGFLAASADSVSGRVLRYSVAGFVPIVGGSLAEALYTVRGCLTALKGSVGGFGILSTVCIALPTLVECVIWNIWLFFSKTAAELFGLAEVAGVCDAAQRTVKAWIAVLSSSALLMIVSVTVVTLAGGGAV